MSQNYIKWLNIEIETFKNKVESYKIYRKDLISINKMVFKTFLIDESKIKSFEQWEACNC